MSKVKEDVCSKLGNCPIFTMEIMMSERTGETFKKYYCLNSEKYKSCKRYQVSEKYKVSIPPRILPNSRLSIEEIIEKIRLN